MHLDLDQGGATNTIIGNCEINQDFQFASKFSINVADKDSSGFASKGRMRNLAAALALALALCAAPARAGEVAFNHVTVVDMVEGRLVRDQMGPSHRGWLQISC